jgi:hypothetical protein
MSVSVLLHQLDDMQIASFLHRIIWLLVACLFLQNFQHCLVKGTIFEKKLIEHKMCVLIFYIMFSEKFLILRRKERLMIKNSIDPHGKYRNSCQF